MLDVKIYPEWNSCSDIRNILIYLGIFLNIGKDGFYGTDDSRKDFIKQAG